MNKIISNFPNYEVSVTGDVFSLSWNRTKRRQKLKPSIRYGYYGVSLCDGIKNHPKRIHRLVAEAFIDNPKQKPFVLHKNGNSLDNRVENLYWGDQFDNMRDRNNHGTAPKGENHHKTKLSEAQVLEIRSSRHLSQTVLAKKFQVSQYNIWAILARKTWRHV